MSVFYEYTTQVGANEAGLFCQCRPSGVLDILQEAATEAACALHVSGLDMMEKYRALWMVTRMWYQLDRPLLWRDQVRVKTWHRANRGVMLYRDFEVFVNGAFVGEAVSVWVLVHADTRKLLRPSMIPELAASGGGALCKDKTLHRIPLPEPMLPAGQRAFHYSDIDSNGHVNNVRYADAAADALKLETLLPEHFVSSLHVNYLKECRAGEVIDLYTGQTGDERFVQGVDNVGKNRFHTSLLLRPLPPDPVPAP